MSIESKHLKKNIWKKDSGTGYQPDTGTGPCLCHARTKWQWQDYMDENGIRTGQAGQWRNSV